jgi:eukaryotic-like serine/threonine-protein kinase
VRLATADDGCPGEDDIAAFLRGGLTAARAQTLEGHVAECAACRRLLSALAHAGTIDTGPTDSVSPTLPAAPTAGEAELQLGARFGRYVVVGLLGAGGMGMVYAAHDPELNRKVALKVLRSDGDDGSRPIRDGLLREAQAMAQLAHPNVVAVFDVGSVEDRVFIAMELVEGVTLRKWLAAAERAPSEILAMFVAAGHGLAAAHAAGLIHRDFKPDNVLIGNDGRVRVTDFGLARPVLRAREAASGAVDAKAGAGGTAHTGLAGTLAYMAPEQYLRRTVDARADQFSFAVALFESLYRERPFGLLEFATGNRARRPVVPARAGGLTMAQRQALVRALSWSPDQRFGSMGELLAALSPAPRRGRWIAAGAIAAALIAIAAAGYAIHLRRAASERAQLVGRLRGLAPDMRAQLRNEQLLPRHDIRPAREKVRGAMRDIERQRATAAGHDEGALIDFVLGEGHRALGEHEQALARLEAAWAGGERGPQIEAALGAALGAVYESQLTQLEATVPSSQREAKRAALEQRYREPAMAHLRSALAAGASSPAYLEALIAFRERRFDDAARIAHRAFAESPTLYEAGVLEARGRHHIALGFNEVNKLAEADAEFAAARQIFERVLEVARSDDEMWLAYSRLVQSQAALRGVPGGGFAPELRKQAVDALHTAREINVERWETYLQEAELYLGEGNVEILRYRDPSAYVDRILPLAEQARAHGAAADQVDQLVCLAHWERAVYQGGHGVDPHPALSEALAACQRALAARVDTGNHSALGIIYAAVATYDGEHGVDPIALFEKAEHHMRAAVAIEDDAGLRYNVGRIVSRRAYYESGHGLDPRPAVERALVEFENTARRDARRSDAWGAMGDALLARAAYQRAVRDDAGPTLAQAREVIERALAGDPELMPAIKGRLMLGELEAEALLERRADPSPVVERSRTDARFVLQRLPDDVFAHRAWARAEIVAARWALARGGAADAALARAASEAARARELDPRDAQAWTVSAEVEQVRAELARARGAHPGAAIDGARAFIEQAMAIDPRRARTQKVRAELTR